ncbi:hypothetical protein S40288_00948 [Stachybotrys chartarum IBT 40288]|nr:hypothetical protein S40288_00948 [Stachybotrys chartarum IBT 40288]
MVSLAPLRRDISSNRFGDYAMVNQGDFHYHPPHRPARAAVRAIPYPRNEGISTQKTYKMHKLVQEAVQYRLNMKRLNEMAAKEGDQDGYKEMKAEMGDWAEVSGKKVDIAELLSRVSYFLYERGRWREKEPVDERAPDLRQEVLGEKHPDAISSMASLAMTYHAQGHHSKAESMQVQVLDLRQEVLGEKHPDTLQAMHSLATTWHACGRRDDALSLMNQCLQRQQSVLGPDHLLTIKFAKSLAQWQQRRSHKVRSFIKRTLAVLKL